MISILNMPGIEQYTLATIILIQMETQKNQAT